MEDLANMLDEAYGISWTLSMWEQGKEEDLQRVVITDRHVLVFSLLNPGDNSHSLPKVAEARLCQVDLTIGVEKVAGILDTGAQRSLLSSRSYERIRAHVPPLLEPPAGAGGLIGASGDPLSVKGSLRRCPILLNGYKYHVNLEVADLGVVDAILGMDFLLAYGAVIDLPAAKVRLRSGIVINTVQEDEVCSDRARVRLRRDWAVQTGHLNRCPVHVDGFEGEGVFLFEPTFTTKDRDCFLTAQIVSVSGGLFDLHMEHRGAGPALELPCGSEMGEIRQIGETEFYTTSDDPVLTCLATYQAATTTELPRRESVSMLLAESKVVDLNDVIGGGIGEDLLSFTLTGELVKTSHDTRNVHHYACPLGEFAIPTVSPETSSGTVLGDMLAKSVVCEGVTVVNDEGFPTLHDHGSVPESCSNRYTESGSCVGAPEGSGAHAAELIALLIPDSHHDVDHVSQFASVGEILNLLPEHVRCVMPSSEESLSLSETKEAVELLLRYLDCFVDASGKVGWTDQAFHSVETGTARPVKQPPRRTSFEEKDQIEKQLSDLLLEGKIQCSESPWASPVLLIKKKDGSWRFCIDYRRLNEATVKDAYPLPRIDEALDMLSGAKWFHTMDLASGYWQVAMNPDDREKTAFCTHMGLYEWLVMPFGLCNSPATFERLMEKVLGGLVWHGVLVYIDDIVAYDTTWKGSLEKLEQVFKRLRRANLKLKAKKCFLFRKEVEYLGHVVCREGIKPLTEKVFALTHWATPVNLEELRSFLGLACYYKQFIESYSMHAAPLNLLTRKNTPFVWGSEQKQAFHNLRAALSAHPCLGTIRRHGQLVVDTDACDVAIGSVLHQIQEGTERVLGYYSKSLNSAQRNYCTTKKELLAIVATFDHWNVYLSYVSEPFMLRTDHAALTWLKTMACRDKAMLRWCDAVNSYSFTIHHRSGAKHQNADSLSRARLARCGWEECPDCIKGLEPFAEEDDGVLTRHNEELTIGLALTRGASRTQFSESLFCETMGGRRSKPGCDGSVVSA